MARALEKLGVPSAADVAALQARVEALEAQLKQRDAKTSPVRTSRKAAPAPAAKKTLRRTKAG
ncbi:hypothetical protein D9M72_657750 [compost metagenome]